MLGRVFMELVLARIPVGRDVGVCRAEDDQNVVTLPDFGPHWIGASDVRTEDAALGGRPAQLERNVVGIESVGPLITSAPSGF